MHRLPLSPLPCLPCDEGTKDSAWDRNGFVDEAAVLTLLTGPYPQREAPDPAEFVLPADDLDYAGWRLSPLPAAQPPRPLNHFSPSAAPPATEPQRATPPVLSEPGLGEPHRGHHRWWLAGLAGAMTTLLVSILLLTLAARTTDHPEENLLVETLAKPRPVIAAEPALPKKPAPQLTDVTP